MKTKNPYELFGTNKNLESGKGVTLQYPGFSITIHRAGGTNKKYGEILENKMRPYRQRYDRGLMDKETDLKLGLEAFAEGVVVGWENVTDKKGKVMPFTVENCIKLFTDLPDLYIDVRAQASNAATFREEGEKVDEKN